jgi:hypothetical protein
MSFSPGAAMDLAAPLSGCARPYRALSRTNSDRADVCAATLTARMRFVNR